MAGGGAVVCHDDAMSDDDLWRHEPSDRPAGADRDPEGEADQTAAAGDEPPGPVSDETQPITGAGPAPAPPGPSYVPPPGPSAVPPPQNPYAAQAPGTAAPQSPHAGQPGPYGQPPNNPYASGFQQPGQQPGQPGGPGYTPPANPYSAPNEYAQPQSPYGGPLQPAYAGGRLPDHPSATTAMVLGIVGLVGILLCGGLTLILSPAAWVVGRKAVREIDSSPGRYAGRDKAQAGKIMGIIGTVLLALGVLAILAVLVLAVAVGGSDQPTPHPSFGSGGA
jgi:hypothetical protein